MNDDEKASIPQHCIMTRAERTDIASAIRQRANLAKEYLGLRAAELRADFERQLATVYSYNTDEVWKRQHAIAESAVQAAQKIIADHNRELGIPLEFAPSIRMDWYGRAENAFKERRSELRKVAYKRIEAKEKQAKLELQRRSLEMQEHLLAGGLESEDAKQFLAAMPTPEQLMPVLQLAEIETATRKKDVVHYQIPPEPLTTEDEE